MEEGIGVVRRNTIRQVFVSHKSKTGQIIKQSILFTFVETSGEICVRRSSGHWPCSTFLVPFPFSRSRTTAACVRVSRKARIDTERKKRSAFFFLLTFTRGFRNPVTLTSSRLFAFNNLKLSRAGLRVCYYLRSFLFDIS